MGEVTPRISASYLEAFANGQTIRIVGKVTQLRGTEATIDANGPITLHLTRVRLDPVTHFPLWRHTYIRLLVVFSIVLRTLVRRC